MQGLTNHLNNDRHWALIQSIKIRKDFPCFPVESFAEFVLWDQGNWNCMTGVGITVLIVSIDMIEFWFVWICNQQLWLCNKTRVNESMQMLINSCFHCNGKLLLQWPCVANKRLEKERCMPNRYQFVYLPIFQEKTGELSWPQHRRKVFTLAVTSSIE